MSFVDKFIDCWREMEEEDKPKQSRVVVEMVWAWNGEDYFYDMNEEQQAAFEFLKSKHGEIFENGRQFRFLMDQEGMRLRSYETARERMNHIGTLDVGGDSELTKKYVLDCLTIQGFDVYLKSREELFARVSLKSIDNGLV